MASTTIQISAKLQQELKERKIADSESYEEVIWELMEDCMELSEETKKEIEESRKEAAEGKLIPFEKIKKDIGI